MSNYAPSQPTYATQYSLADLKTIVSQDFNITDAFIDVTGNPTFIIAVEPLKDKFKALANQLSSLGLLPMVRRGEANYVLKLFSKPPIKAGRRGLSPVLFIVTLVTIFIAGYLLWIGNPLWSQRLMPKANPYLQAAIYTACLAGIIGSHELGHKLVCNRHGLAASTPYFIPGFPPFGTFGAIISLKSPPTNKDELFDIGLAGPLAGFVIMILVTFLSMALGVSIPETQAASLEQQKLVGSVSWPGSPLLFSGIFWIVDALRIYTLPHGWTLVLGQTLFAAWVGSLVTFLNLLPIWQLDGGHISRAVFGSKGHRITSIIGLAVLVVSGYWFFALFLILLMTASRHAWAGAEPLEDISPLSRSRALFYLIVLAILALTFVTPPG